MTCAVGWEYSLPESVGHVGGVWDVELNVTNGPVIWLGAVSSIGGCVNIQGVFLLNLSRPTYTITILYNHNISYAYTMAPYSAPSP